MKFLTLALFLISSTTFAAKLSDSKPFKFEVLFTNPVCKQYNYRKPLISNEGKEIFGKKKNAYCKSSDSSRSARRKNSPHSKLIEWIRNPNTKEIFMAYLSFSKTSIAKELCQAIKKRSVKVTLVFDSNNEADQNRMATANFLSRCKPANRSSYPVVKTSGNSGRGRNRVGYAHNKLFMVNPNSQKEVRIAFSSGNMSSGTVTHHENWNFVTTSGKTYFAAIHRCLMEGVQNYDQDKETYTNFIKSCRSKIEVTEEDDIKVFFIPGDGEAATKTVLNNIKKSKQVEVAAHRFSYNKLMAGLTSALKSGTDVSLLADDDLYYIGVYHQGMGRNGGNEYRAMKNLEKLGMKTYFMETYMDDVFDPQSLQLHHNKFLIFSYKNPRSEKGAVFTGAGNLTGAAFNNNFENFYFITIPSVYEAFKKQYKHYTEDLARTRGQMPTELVLP